MRLTCPINWSDEAKELIKNGADEFYLGYYSKKWNDRYSIIASQNRRYFKESNIKNLDEIKRIVRFKKPVYVAFNSPYYIEEQYPLVMDEIKKILLCGINALIISDIPLILQVKKHFPKTKIILSTVATSLNSDSALFYESLGVSRIILPRHLTFNEIKTIRKNIDIELEVFILFDWCKNIDGLCTFHHGMESLIGKEHGCVYVNEYSSGEKIIDNRMKISFTNFCAACHLNEFEKIGIDAAKIVGRRLPTGYKVNALKFLKQDPTPKGYFNTFNKRCPRNCNVY